MTDIQEYGNVIQVKSATVYDDDGKTYATNSKLDIIHFNAQGLITLLDEQIIDDPLMTRFNAVEKPSQVSSAAGRKAEQNSRAVCGVFD